ncbi:MAG: hypothetical protein WC728_14455 [Elusimicrobiota bacterium]
MKRKTASKVPQYAGVLRFKKTQRGVRVVWDFKRLARVVEEFQKIRTRQRKAWSVDASRGRKVYGIGIKKQFRFVESAPLWIEELRSVLTVQHPILGHQVLCVPRVVSIPQLQEGKIMTLLRYLEQWPMRPRADKRGAPKGERACTAMLRGRVLAEYKNVVGQYPNESDAWRYKEVSRRLRPSHRISPQRVQAFVLASRKRSFRRR